MLYDDGKIALDDSGLLIRRYDPGGNKRIPFGSIRSIGHLSPLGARRWRLWGSGESVHWWNLDPDRLGPGSASATETERLVGRARVQAPPPPCIRRTQPSTGCTEGTVATPI